MNSRNRQEQRKWTTNKIIERLTQEIEELTKSPWISVEDRLPEKNNAKGCNLGESVIVDVYLDKERWCDCYYSFDEEEWFDTDVHVSIDGVTHWMPRPNDPQQ